MPKKAFKAKNKSKNCNVRGKSVTECNACLDYKNAFLGVNLERWNGTRIKLCLKSDNDFINYLLSLAEQQLRSTGNAQKSNENSLNDNEAETSTKSLTFQQSKQDSEVNEQDVSSISAENNNACDSDDTRIKYLSSSSPCEEKKKNHVSNLSTEHSSVDTVDCNNECSISVVTTDNYGACDMLQNEISVMGNKEGCCDNQHNLNSMVDDVNDKDVCDDVTNKCNSNCNHNDSESCVNSYAKGENKHRKLVRFEKEDVKYKGKGLTSNLEIKINNNTSNYTRDCQIITDNNSSGIILNKGKTRTTKLLRSVNDNFIYKTDRSNGCDDIDNNWNEIVKSDNSNNIAIKNELEQSKPKQKKLIDLNYKPNEVRNSFKTRKLKKMNGNRRRRLSRYKKSCSNSTNKGEHKDDQSITSENFVIEKGSPVLLSENYNVDKPQYDTYSTKVVCDIKKMKSFKEIKSISSETSQLPEDEENEIDHLHSKIITKKTVDSNDTDIASQGSTIPDDNISVLGASCPVNNSSSGHFRRIGGTSSNLYSRKRLFNDSCNENINNKTKFNNIKLNLCKSDKKKKLMVGLNCKRNKMKMLLLKNNLKKKGNVVKRNNVINTNDNSFSSVENINHSNNENDEAEEELENAGNVETPYGKRVSSITIKLCCDCDTRHLQDACPLQNPVSLINDSVVDLNFLSVSHNIIKNYASYDNDKEYEISNDGFEMVVKNCFAKASLPNCLQLKLIDPEHGLSIITKMYIPAYTRFGPLIGSPIKEMEIPDDFSMKDVWEVINKDGVCSKYISTQDPQRSNWLRWLRPAPNRENRNLVPVEKDSFLYFVTITAIEEGNELLYWAEERFTSSSVWSNKKMTKTNCGGCNLRFSHPIYYRRHCAVFHDPKFSLTIRKYHCKVCGLSVLGKENIMKHASDKHDGKGAYQCRFCKKFFLRLNYLEMHRTYGCAANPQRTRPLCDYCGRKFCQPQKLKIHIKRMHSEMSEVLREFQCKRCLKVLGSRAALQRHTKEVHFKSQLGQEGAVGVPVSCPTCEKCGKMFQNKSNLKIHMLTHSGVKPFRCQGQVGCKAAFTTKQCLQFHYKKVHGFTDIKMMPRIERSVAYTFDAYAGETGMMDPSVEEENSFHSDLGYEENDVLEKSSIDISSSGITKDHCTKRNENIDTGDINGTVGVDDSHGRMMIVDSHDNNVSDDGNDKNSIASLDNNIIPDEDSREVVVDFSLPVALSMHDNCDNQSLLLSKASKKWMSVKVPDNKRDIKESMKSRLESRAYSSSVFVFEDENENTVVNKQNLCNLNKNQSPVVTDEEQERQDIDIDIDTVDNRDRSPTFPLSSTATIFHHSDSGFHNSTHHCRPPETSSSNASLLVEAALDAAEKDIEMASAPAVSGLQKLKFFQQSPNSLPMLHRRAILEEDSSNIGRLSFVQSTHPSDILYPVNSRMMMMMNGPTSVLNFGADRSESPLSPADINNGEVLKPIAQTPDFSIHSSSVVVQDLTAAGTTAVLGEGLCHLPPPQLGLGHNLPPPPPPVFIDSPPAPHPVGYPVSLSPIPLSQNPRGHPTPGYGLVLPATMDRMLHYDFGGISPTPVTHLDNSSVPFHLPPDESLRYGDLLHSSHRRLLADVERVSATNNSDSNDCNNENNNCNTDVDEIEDNEITSNDNNSSGIQNLSLVGSSSNRNNDSSKNCSSPSAFRLNSLTNSAYNTNGNSSNKYGNEDSSAAISSNLFTLLHRETTSESPSTINLFPSSVDTAENGLDMSSSAGCRSSNNSSIDTSQSIFHHSRWNSSFISIGSSSISHQQHHYPISMYDHSRCTNSVGLPSSATPYSSQCSYSILRSVNTTDQTQTVDLSLSRHVSGDSDDRLSPPVHLTSVVTESSSTFDRQSQDVADRVDHRLSETADHAVISASSSVTAAMYHQTHSAANSPSTKIGNCDPVTTSTAYHHIQYSAYC